MRPISSPSASVATAQVTALSAKPAKIKEVESPPATKAASQPKVTEKVKAPAADQKPAENATPQPSVSVVSSQPVASSDVVSVAAPTTKAEPVLVASAESARDTAAALAGEVAAELQRTATLADNTARPASETKTDDTSVAVLKQPVKPTIVETKPVENETVVVQPVVEQTVVAAPPVDVATKETTSAPVSTSSAPVTSDTENKTGAQIPIKPSVVAVKRRKYVALNERLAGVEKQLAQRVDKQSNLSDIVQRLDSLMSKFERVIELLYDRTSSRREPASAGDIRQLSKFARTSQQVLRKLPAPSPDDAQRSLIDISQRLSRALRLLQSTNDAGASSRRSENSPSLAALTRAYNDRSGAKGVGLALNLFA